MPPVWVFFYGTFMSANVLREYGIRCEATIPARLAGYALSIRPRVNLTVDAEAYAYGGLARIQHEEVARLYDELREEVGIAYCPYPVLAEVEDGSMRSALCFMSAHQPDEPPDPAYIRDMVRCARGMRAPSSYIAQIEAFGRTDPAEGREVTVR